MSNLLRRIAPAVFMGTAAVLVVSSAGNGAPVAADATSGTSDPVTTPQQRGGTFDLFGDEDHDDDWFGHDDDDDDDDAPRSQVPAAPAPGSGTTGGGTNTGGTTNSTGSCSAAEITGPVVRTEWGPVQVAAKVEGGRVCAVRTIQYPDGDRKSVMINARAIPAIEQQVLAAGNANFDGVSGATVTSDGYQRSLQAILDQAR